MFSSYISNFTQKFLGVYFLLKQKLTSFFFKLVFFKIIFLRGQKVLVLANVYRVQKRLNSSIRKSGVGGIREKQKVSFLVKKSRKKDMFGQFLLAKRYPVKEVSSTHGNKKGMFKMQGLDLTFVNFKTERCLERLLLFPVEVKLKNIFSLKKKRATPISLVSLCRVVYKKTKLFWELQHFLFLKDSINILSLSFFYQKSGLLADYVADIIKFRRKFFFELRKFKGLLSVFKKHYFLTYGTSLRINVLGKLFGQRKRRFRCFSIEEGLKFSTQDIKLNVSYSLTQT